VARAMLESARKITRRLVATPVPLRNLTGVRSSGAAGDANPSTGELGSGGHGRRLAREDRFAAGRTLTRGAVAHPWASGPGRARTEANAAPANSPPGQAALTGQARYYGFLWNQG
jgi:hypothetical protein